MSKKIIYIQLLLILFSFSILSSNTSESEEIPKEVEPVVQSLEKECNPKQCDCHLKEKYEEILDAVTTTATTFHIVSSVSIICFIFAKMPWHSILKNKRLYHIKIRNNPDYTYDEDGYLL